MKLTAGLKKFAEERLGVAAGSADNVYVEAITKALSESKLSALDFAKLSEESDPRKEVAGIVADSVKAAMDDLRKEMSESLAKLNVAAPAPAQPATVGNEAIEKAMAALAERMEKIAAGQKPIEAPKTTETGTNVNPAKVFGQDRIEAVKAIDKYDRTRKGAYYTIEKHGRTGPIMAGSKALDFPSHADLAIAGAVMKNSILRQTRETGLLAPLTDHEKELVAYAANECTWSGRMFGEELDRQKLSDFQTKAILDSSTSGGEEAVPDVFDEAVVLTPLLYGELFPLVDLVTLTRGSSVDGFAMANPTWHSNEGDGSNATLETTTSFITAFDTTIFPSAGAIELGLDFLSDTPVNIGQLLVMKFGEALQAWLDNQIANGDGTTEPQGIFVASGTTTVASEEGTSGPYTVQDVEKLQFGVSKAYRMAKGGRNVYVGNDTTYRRIRAIKVGTSDERRIFGMDHGSYQLLNFPYKVQGDIADTHIAFCNMGFYKMYRRAGLSTKVETGGKELTRYNQMLIVCRARFGGKLSKGGACAKMTSGQLAKAG